MKLIRPPRSFAPCLNSSALIVVGLILISLPPESARAQVYNRATYSSPIAISRNDRLIWVVNPSDDSVSVIRPDNNTRITKIPVGDEPESIALTPDGQYAWVANAAAGTVTAILISDPAWGTFSASVVTNLTTGGEPWNIVTSPDGLRVFVANSAQDTITVIDATNRTIIGHVDLRDSLANDPDRNRHFQPRGLAVTEDNTKLYVTRFLSFTKSGGRQGDDLGKEGLVAVLDINTASSSINDYQVARTVPLAPQITGFRFPGLTNPPAPDTFAFPNQLQSIVIRGSQAYLPNIAASPTGPLRFNLDTHAFVSVIDGVTGTTPADAGTNKFLNLHLGARDPEPGKRREFFANPWAIAFTTQSGAGNAYAVSAASDLLVKLNVDAAGKLSFTVDGDTTRFIDLNDPTNALTSGVNAGKNPQGISINSTGTVAYVANFVSRNVSVVDLTTDSVIAVVPTSDLPTPGSQGETNLVGAEMFFSSRGNFDTIPGTNSLRDRLSSEGWQSCASCHFKGLTDGVIWQFAAGPRKSVPLHSSFNPQNRSQQRLLNYSAIFDEIEDFEANIRNVSGPGNLAVPINGNALNPNQGLLIGDTGDLNVAPSAVNAFALPSANRPQVTVTLPGSPNKVPALTAMREWVRFAVRTPNGPAPGLPNAPAPADIAAGRALFTQSCSRCHGGQNWTVSLKDFAAPPLGVELSTERTGTFTGNPVGAQFLNRFLRDVGSFNLGVPGQGNPLGNNIGADEKAAPAVVAGVQEAAQDALGIDYNNDTRGVGFNVPSLLGLHAVQPYMHNGAAESLAAVVADVKHRTDNGRIPDVLSNPTDQAKVVSFVATIDASTAPVFDVGNRPTYSSPIAISRNDKLIWVVNPSDDSVSVIRPDNNTRITKISVGDEPQSVALTPDGQYAWVANAAAGTVTAILISDPAWGTFSASVVTNLTTGAEPWNITCSPDGLRVFVANSAQDTITVIDATTRTIIGHVDLRNSLANDPDRNRQFQPRGLAVTADNSKLYVTRFLSFTKPGGRQGDDLGKEGLVAVLDINTSSANLADYKVARVIPLAAQITGFKFPGLTNPPAPDTFAFPNQLQSIVLRGESAYLPNIAASPTGPLRFNLDTHAFVSVIDGANSTSPLEGGTNKFLNLHLGARDPEPGKRREFFANPWGIAFTSELGAGSAYAVSAASDLLVKLNVDAAGKLSFTVDGDTTRYIDLNDPTNALTSGVNAGKNPQGIAINSTGTVAYVANFVSRNVSVVDLTSDSVIAVVPTSDLPTPGSQGETNLVGAEMFFSSRGNFDTIPGTNSLRDRLSSEGWQSCASCHFKGLTDGVIWQFAAGPRKSVPLHSSFNPQNRSQQRLLNYSAIFDEIEDFEANIRNVSGPGNLAAPINGNALNPNQGLLIGDTGDLNVAPSAVNAFALPSANRPQVTVTLPGSPNKVPALTAMREWVRFAVRTPNAPLPGLPNAPAPTDIVAGRALFTQSCSRCHGGQNWTVSLKDFAAPPLGVELSTERTGTFTGNPVGAQFLNRFLRDIGSFNLGVPGQGNPLGNNIGADEKAAPAVVAGVQQAAQDALGIDYNNDTRGVGFNVPSLLGLHAVQPYMHNGAAESLAAIVADVKHRTDNGRIPDVLSNPTDQAKVVAFVATIDASTAPVFDVANRPTYSSPIAISRNDKLIWVVNPGDDSVSVIRPDNNTRITKITVGDEPQSVALTPDGQYAWVANAAAGTVTAILISDPAWGTFSASVVTNVTTGSEPWNIVCSPDGKRIFVANSGQDTITVIDALARDILGHVDLRNSVANDPDRTRHFQPRGLAVTADNSKLYVTRFLSFTKPGGRQGDDLGREGVVAVLDINTGSANLADYKVARVIPLAPQITGFRFPGLTNPPAPDTFAFPNQLQSVVLRGESAYLPNIAASPTGPLRFNLDTHAFVSVIDGVNSTSPLDGGTNKFLNLHLGARDPEPGKRREFFANPWAIAFASELGAGTAYAVSAASDLLVKVNVDATGKLSFTVDGDTTRYIDLNDPTNPLTSGANAGKNPQGITINSTGTVAYVANFISRNVSVVDLTTDSVIAVVPTSDLPTPGSPGETNLVGAEVFFSSRGNFDTIPGTNSLRDRLSSEGWQSCASCHFKGLTDGVIWQFAAGPRKSVPLNASFSPHNRSLQRVLNYSAIFDEIEDFEANIRNVSGPGNLAVPINGNALNPNQGLLIGDTGDLNIAPSAVNAFALPSANRPQVTVTLPGSTNKVPALTAMREWVRNAVRTLNAPLPGTAAADISAGRQLFLNAGCASCHGGLNWTVSVKDFTSPPAGSEGFTITERNPAQVFGNPVGAQYLNRFLRDIGSFNKGVPGKTNDLGNNIGADELAAPTVAAGALVAGQDALGIDYNADGRGIGFNVPSLLGLHAVPPFLHNGAAESLAAVVADVKHRTDNGRLPDGLSDPNDQAKVVKFLESIDVHTVPFVPVQITQSGPYVILSFDTVNGVQYGVEARSTLTGAPSIIGTFPGTGQPLQVQILNDSTTRFLRLVSQ